MTTVDQGGYVARARKGAHLPGRNWWMVKGMGAGSTYGYIKLGQVSVPPEYLGKRIRFKIEVLS